MGTSREWAQNWEERDFLFVPAGYKFSGFTSNIQITYNHSQYVNIHQIQKLWFKISLSVYLDEET